MDIIQLDENNNEVERKVRKRRKSNNSRRIMEELLNYQRSNSKVLEYPVHVKNHKFRMLYHKCYLGDRHTGNIYIQAHLKHLLGRPRYWNFEFRFEGNITRVTLYDYTLYKLLKKVSFWKSEHDFISLTVKERYDYLIQQLSRLVDRFIELSQESLRKWFTSSNILDIRENPYRREYKKMTRAVSPRSRPHITIIDE